VVRNNHVVAAAKLVNPGDAARGPFFVPSL